MWFGGNWSSEEESSRLRKLLRTGFEELSGLQQPPHSESEKEAKQAKRAYKEGEKRVEDIARDLYCALTGKEILKTRKTK
jgi:hypothetical protein